MTEIEFNHWVGEVQASILGCAVRDKTCADDLKAEMSAFNHIAKIAAESLGYEIFSD